MKPNNPETAYYEIVKRNTRIDQDLKVLPKTVKGRRVAQATVERLQRALESTSTGTKTEDIRWLFRGLEVVT